MTNFLVQYHSTLKQILETTYEWEGPCGYLGTKLAPCLQRYLCKSKQSKPQGVLLFCYFFFFFPLIWLQQFSSSA